MVPVIIDVHTSDAVVCIRRIYKRVLAKQSYG